VLIEDDRNAGADVAVDCLRRVQRDDLPSDQLVQPFTDLHLEERFAVIFGAAAVAVGTAPGSGPARRSQDSSCPIGAFLARRVRGLADGHAASGTSASDVTLRRAPRPDGLDRPDRAEHEVEPEELPGEDVLQLVRRHGIGRGE
jgi:hypothetical protein